MRATPGRGIGTHAARPLVAWEEPPCPLCGGRRHEPVLQAQDTAAGPDGLWFAVARCLECGLAYTSPRPQRDAMRAFDAERRESPVLACEGAGRTLVVEGELPASGAFDTIVMPFALERQHRPVELLDDARALLVPGGTLVAVASNFASWSAGRFGTHWAGLDLPRRLIHFTPPTLRKMLERADFTIRDLRTLPRPDWVRRSARASGNRGWAVKPVAWLAANVAARCGRGDTLLAVASV